MASDQKNSHRSPFMFWIGFILVFLLGGGYAVYWSITRLRLYSICCSSTRCIFEEKEC